MMAAPQAAKEEQSALTDRTAARTRSSRLQRGSENKSLIILIYSNIKLKSLFWMCQKLLSSVMEE